MVYKIGGLNKMLIAVIGKFRVVMHEHVAILLKCWKT
jgi:hypothetical protein